MRTVAALLIEDFALFEFGVICEVFGVDRTDDGAPAFDFRVVGEQAATPVRSSIGIRTTPYFGLNTLAEADLVALPACTVRDQYPPEVLDALRAAIDRGATLLSVCTGAFLLGAAGLLDNRPCTTHWRFTTMFAQRFPAAKLDPDVLFVDDGNIITSAGTAAGIDACLHLVRREFGSRAATVIARRMVVSPQRDGGQRQYIELPVCESDTLHPVLTWMLEHLGEDHTVANLARHAQMSERTFARKFAAETGSTPHKWLTGQRVLHARRLLEETTLSIDEIARQCGFGTAALLRHHFHRGVGVGPTDYRRTFSRH
ncbi:transcriptional regulator GlxA family with amidase domain [Kibdelosporangium banguiense]|uniref:Transcriptional regulator GlxA family with amidase domain n=1 Tax=Kibdelosporangium banguiense TaxID=1365924 RepID=A0ABS4TSD4_9PSEU|nr:helix-turn-helix domain-containing protein [Kibdelosporangium banguiense]MBP2327301.1 transcriptional regulator GlxA family with amidase domain [Kibdelosporangium banguiense]